MCENSESNENTETGKNSETGKISETSEKANLEKVVRPAIKTNVV